MLKQLKTFEEQVAILKQHGCVIDDEETCIRVLAKFGALEAIEISLKTRLAYLHGHHYGPLGYLDQKYDGRFPIWVITELFSFSLIDHVSVPTGGKKSFIYHLRSGEAKEITLE